MKRKRYLISESYLEASLFLPFPPVTFFFILVMIYSQHPTAQKSKTNGDFVLVALLEVVILLYTMLSSPFVPCTPYMNLVLLNLDMLVVFVVWSYLYFTLPVLWFLPHRSVKLDKTIIPVLKRDLTCPFSSASFFFSYHFLLPDYFCTNSACCILFLLLTFLSWTVNRGPMPDRQLDLNLQRRIRGVKTLHTMKVLLCHGNSR